MQRFDFTSRYRFGEFTDYVMYKFMYYKHMTIGGHLTLGLGVDQKGHITCGT